MVKDKKCKICKEPLKGEMVFYPEICLSCVIEHGSKDELNKLKKWDMKDQFQKTLVSNIS